MPTLDVRQVLLCILLCGVIGNAADLKGGSKLRKVLLPNNGIVSFIEQGPADGPALIIISTSTAFSSAVPSAGRFQFSCKKNGLGVKRFCFSRLSIPVVLMATV
eukprot:6197107-Pleurochrysis_carterae.AAC.2